MSNQTRRDVWFLSNDKRPLADGIVPAVSRDPHVVGVGDALIKDARCQTYRYTALTRGGSDA